MIMAIIKRTVKLGTALGITYLSVEQKLWSQLSDKEIKDKLSALKSYQKNAITLVTEKTGLNTSYIKEWIPTQESLDAKSMNAKNVWNRSIKTTFRVLSDIDLNDLVAKLQKLLNTK